MTAKTNKERQAAYRARKAAADLPEVRGIFAPFAAHPAIKAVAVKLSAGQRGSESSAGCNQSESIQNMHSPAIKPTNKTTVNAVTPHP
jgi:hypothetical protein